MQTQAILPLPDVLLAVASKHTKPVCLVDHRQRWLQQQERPKCHLCRQATTCFIVNHNEWIKTLQVVPSNLQAGWPRLLEMIYRAARVWVLDGTNFLLINPIEVKSGKQTMRTNPRRMLHAPPVLPQKRERGQRRPQPPKRKRRKQVVGKRVDESSAKAEVVERKRTPPSREQQAPVTVVQVLAVVVAVARAGLLQRRQFRHYLPPGKIHFLVMLVVPI
jgi:hypothetical protein